MREQRVVSRDEQEAAFKKFLSPASDRQSRYNWSIAWASILVNQCDVDKLFDIKEGGYARFSTYATDIKRKHGFKEEDIRRVYDIICKTAEMNSAQRRRFTNGLIVQASR